MEMSSRIAINGLGRIGRALLKVVTDEPAFELVAVNDLIDVENLAYLLRYDTVYGRYAKSVAVDGSELVVAGRKLRTLRSRDPVELPWKELGVELVFECTGALTHREVGSLERGQAHLDRKEANAAANGHVGAAEQANVQASENRQSRRIYRKKHNARTQ